MNPAEVVDMIVVAVLVAVGVLLFWPRR